jgi:alcohol dehydrogenase class IV
MDALTHAIESYTNKSYQPISEALSYRAIALIGANLIAAVKSGSDRDARYAMMLGSMLAGLAMNPTRLGAVHALAMPLGSGSLGIPHGAANAVMLPHVMEFNIPAASEKYAMVAKALGVKADGKNDEALAAEGLSKLRSMTASIGIPAGMGGLGLTRAAVPVVCEEAMKSGNIAVNPRPITQKDLEEICYRAL